MSSNYSLQKHFHLFNKRFIDEKLYNNIDIGSLGTAINIKRITKNRARKCYKKHDRYTAEKFLNNGTHLLINLTKLGGRL